MRTRCLLVAIVSALLLVVAGTASAQGVSGAVFTTDSTGSFVNQNVYGAKEDAYLNGGPPPNAPCTAGGLDDGAYFFQVTDPSGQTLLSTDTILDRQFAVADGLIISAATHLTGTGKCVAVNAANVGVQLAPFADTPNAGGEYKVWVTPQAEYIADTGSGFPSNSKFGFVPSHSKTDNFKVLPAPPTNKIEGLKFYDSDADGVLDTGETGIAGWIVSIEGAGGFGYSTTTDLAGKYLFANLDAGTYGVCEVLPASAPTWLPTTATSISGITVPPDSANNNFGNVCLGSGGGLTLGFWSNKNGQFILTGSKTGNVINAVYANLLLTLKLRTAGGAQFTATGDYGKFRTWLLGATATNMAYMLSAQLAAMALNVQSGGVVGTQLIYAPGTSSANAAGFATVNAVMAEAVASLTAYSVTLSGNPERAHQEALKDALDNANNNKNFVQAPGTCAVNYNGTETCVVK